MLNPDLSIVCLYLCVRACVSDEYKIHNNFLIMKCISSLEYMFYLQERGKIHINITDISQHHRHISNPHLLSVEF